MEQETLCTHRPPEERRIETEVIDEVIANQRIVYAAEL